MKRLFLTCVIIVAIPLSSHADLDVNTRFQLLTKEIRCVVCQNQSIADSEAPLAGDLRMKVKTMLNEGKSNAQIKDYLVARYGEFILFKPRLKASTWLLWFFPFIALIVLTGVILRFSRRTESDTSKIGS